VMKFPRFRRGDFSNRHSAGISSRFWTFGQKFLEKGVFFFASFLLDEQKKGWVDKKYLVELRLTFLDFAQGNSYQIPRSVGMSKCSESIV
jgi:hypothetical protein